MGAARVARLGIAGLPMTTSVRVAPVLYRGGTRGVDVEQHTNDGVRTFSG